MERRSSNRRSLSESLGSDWALLASIFLMLDSFSLLLSWSITYWKAGADPSDDWCIYNISCFLSLVSWATCLLRDSISTYFCLLMDTSEANFYLSFMTSVSADTILSISLDLFWEKRDPSSPSVFLEYPGVIVLIIWFFFCFTNVVRVSSVSTGHWACRLFIGCSHFRNPKPQPHKLVSPAFVNFII